MKVVGITLFTLIIMQFCKAQIPVNMSAKAGFTYLETFADINNWVYNTTPADGTFIYGEGAAAWRGIAVGGTATIPDATRITAQTTAFQLPFTPGSLPTSSGIQRGSGSMVLLTTGTTDNSTSTAMDLFLDFTGVTAGTLSFDWGSINNSTGNRTSTLRIYTSTNGITFTELSAAAVQNVVNNVPTSGSITNIALPASFNNVATAQIRFYCYNGVGGTTGSRPRVNIDNVKVTATSTNGACTNPTAQPTNFTAGTITNYSVQASFTAPAAAPQNYLVIASNNTSLSAGPVNGVNYNLGANVGDGSVVAFTRNNSFTATGLNPNSTYNFFIFAMNSNCTGGPLYLQANPLIGSATTLAGGSVCVAPTTQATALTFANTNTNSTQGSFTATTADEYLVVRSTSATLSVQPINRAMYNPGDALGGGIVVARSSGTNFSSTGLSSGTTYYYFVYAISSFNCNNGPTYNVTSPLIASVTTQAVTACVTPTAQPTSLILKPSNNAVSGSFTAFTGADEYLVLLSTSATLTATPQNGVNYTVGSTLGNSTVINNNSATAFYATNLTPSTNYYIFVFSKNSICTGGVKYLTTTPLFGSTTTTATPTSNYFFGNLHAHSIYSDGGKDNSALTPAAAYAYAKNSLCMDFLGVSEHNHVDAGMSKTNWIPGITQAATATTPNFLALYGMEWGVISGGGHTLVYGTDKLLGWDAGNYDIFVAKSDYTGTPSTTGTTGLFRTINNLGNNAFAALAHPNTTDYNNLVNQPYNSTADSALAGAAIESGPAFSTATNYSDPGTSLSYLWYYNLLLAKGYHVSPFIDHDNHNTTFGRTAYSRLAVIAPALNSTEFLKAVKNRQVYATQDCDTRINFTINTQPMGSIFAGATSPGISVYATDPTNPTAVPKIKIMYGKPGSGVNAILLDSANGNTFNFTDYRLADKDTGYYYADISIGSQKIISSPIWYTRNSTLLPVTLVSLTASVTDVRTIAVAWETTHEIDNKMFVIERSIDGIQFTAIGTVEAQNNTTKSSYRFIDNMPFNGLNYYRLQQVDKDGKTTYSATVTANTNKAAINYFTLYPNPVQYQATLLINAQTEQIATLTISDATGRILQSNKVALVKGSQQYVLPTSSLTTGNYYATLQFNNTVITQKITRL